MFPFMASSPLEKPFIATVPPRESLNLGRLCGHRPSYLGSSSTGPEHPSVHSWVYRAFALFMGALENYSILAVV